MTHDEAHKAAAEGATMAVFMSRAEGDDIVATAAITAYLAEMEAAGFVVVPVEPTREMLDAANRLNHPRDVEIYRAMLAARPKVTPETAPETPGQIAR